MYTHDQAHIPAEAHISFELVKTLHARHTLRIVRSYVNKGRLLEIGSGAGYFLREARESGFDVESVELNPAQADFIRESLAVVCHTEIPGRDRWGTFDIIYSCDVLSHLYDPIVEVQQMRNLLRPGGLLIFETGNLADVEQKYYSLYPVFQYPDHLYFFGSESTRRLLAKCGLKVIEVKGYSIVPQLMVRRAIRTGAARIKGTRRSGPHAASKGMRDSEVAEPPSDGTVRGDPTLKQRGREVGTELLVRAEHAVRYGLGSLAPKEGRSQTVIVIARRE